jgi:hypothetical protein
MLQQIFPGFRAVSFRSRVSFRCIVAELQMLAHAAELALKNSEASFTHTLLLDLTSASEQER